MAESGTMKADPEATIGAYTDVNDITKVRINDMLRVRKLKESEAQLSHVLETTKENLSKALENLENESKQRRDAEGKLAAAMESGETLRLKMEQLEKDMKVKDRRLGSLKDEYEVLEDKFEDLCEQKSVLAVQLALAKEQITKQVIQLQQQNSDEISKARGAESAAIQRREDLEIKFQEMSHSSAMLKGINEGLKLEIKKCEHWRETAKKHENTIVDLRAESERKSLMIEETKKKGEDFANSIKEKLEIKRAKKRNWKKKYQEMCDLLQETEGKMSGELKKKELTHQAEITALNDALVESGQKIATIRKEHDDYVKELSRRIDEMERASVADTKHTINNVVDWKLEALSRTREAVKKAQEDAEGDLNEMKRKIQNLDNARAASAEQHAAVAFELQEERGRHSGLEKQIKELRQMLEVATQEAKQANELNGHFIASNDQFRDQLAELIKELAGTKDELSTARMDVKKYQNEHLDVNNRLGELVEELAQTKARLAAASEFETQCLKLKTDLEQLQLKFDAVRESQKQKMLEIDELEHKVAQEKACRQKIEQESAKEMERFHGTQRLLKEKEAKLDALENQIISVQSQLMESQRHVSQLQADVSKCQDKVRQEQEESESLKGQLKQFKELAVQNERTISDLEERNMSIQNDLNGARNGLWELAQSKVDNATALGSWVDGMDAQVRELLQRAAQAFSATLTGSMKTCSTHANEMSKYSLLEKTYKNWVTWKTNSQSKCKLLPARKVRQEELVAQNVGPQDVQKLVVDSKEVLDMTIADAQSRQDRVLKFLQLVIEALKPISQAFDDYSAARRNVTKRQLMKVSVFLAETQDTRSAMDFLGGENKVDPEIVQYVDDFKDGVLKTVEEARAERDEAGRKRDQTQQKLDVLTRVRDEHIVTIAGLNQKIGEVTALNHHLQQNLHVLEADHTQLQTDHSNVQNLFKREKHFCLELKKKNEELGLKVSDLETDIVACNRRNSELQIPLQRERKALLAKQKTFGTRLRTVLDSVRLVAQEHHALQQQVKQGFQVTWVSLKGSLQEIEKAVITTVRNEQHLASMLDTLHSRPNMDHPDANGNASTEAD